MEKTLGKDIENRIERIAFLRDNADAIVEDFGYTKMLSNEKLDELKDKLAENNIKLRDVRAYKKERVKIYNDQIKELEEEGDELTAQLKSRTEYVSETCYQFIEEDQVYYFNADGDMIFQRQAKPEERQPTIFSQLRKTGTEE